MEEPLDGGSWTTDTAVPPVDIFHGLKEGGEYATKTTPPKRKRKNQLATPPADDSKMYRPLQIFNSTSVLQPPACLVILNRDLRGLDTVIRNHWSKFSVVLCADGGANRLFDSVREREELVPHTICGDFDSARLAVLQYYQQRGSRVVKVEDQDTTDFDKAMRQALDLRRKGDVAFSSIYAMNALGGRFDQTLGNLQTLFMFQTDLEGTPLYLLSETSIAVLLSAGESVVSVDSGLEQVECGLLPLGESCGSCSTSGLRWNLSSQAMRFGGLVSTSNQLLPARPPVHITASSPLLWTMSHTLCET